MIESGDRKISDETTEFLADTVDITLGMLGCIPMVGAVLDGAKLVGSIPDRLFRAKSRKFFEEIDKASIEEISAFARQLEREEKLTDFGRNVLFFIDKMDDLEKPVIVGRLFRAAVEKKIELETVRRISALVNSVYSADLKTLTEFRSASKGKDPDVASSLESAGFLKRVAEDWGDDSGNSVTFVLNRYGSALVEFGLTL